MSNIKRDYCQLYQEQLSHAANLQRMIYLRSQGKDIPDELANTAPHSAKLLMSLKGVQQ